ncbi:MAG: Tex family protein [Lachnospiraceae bacterium]|nr:Tex family protein [Lachnospiraceae bacterium]
MNIIQILAEELKIKQSQVEATIGLIDDGNTIPFIARYRKEVTGSLDDETLRNLDERLRYLRNLEEKQQQVIASIEEQGKLTDELKEAIESATTLVAVDDLYRPYRPKKRTRAMIAKEAGYEPLSIEIMEQDPAKHELLDAADAKAIQGAKDIIAETVSDNAEFRKAIRNATYNLGLIESSLKEAELDPDKTYEMYYEYSEAVSKCPGHRILALNRGEDEKVLKVSIIGPDEDIIRVLNKYTITNPGNTRTAEIIADAVADSYKRLIQPAIEREIRNDLTEKAQDGAIKVFGKNLNQLLMQPPIVGKTVLGWDPAFRTGCKLAVVDDTGKVLDTTVIYPTAPQFRIAESQKIVNDLIRKYKIDLISLGNGTASRESEQVIADGIKAPYVIVNEAGASVYSASKLATEEFPNFDVGQRSATSMARRLQDPLAELVKIDPKAIGVGQYQHDMDQKKLGESLGAVVEDCVNAVGVDLNTASASLLQYISGINKTLAKNIVDYREANGRFKTRKELLKVPKLGPKAFEQCAGFMRITGGKEPLDATSVHPESYEAARALQAGEDRQSIMDRLGVGEITLNDIAKELKKPGRDPREDMPKPILRTDVLEMKDLHEGMILKGTVRNVIDFGAFVDIGVHQDGLVHISQMSSKYIKHPLEVVSVGDIVDVKVISVDLQKKRIGLTMIF